MCVWPGGSVSLGEGFGEVDGLFLGGGGGEVGVWRVEV